MKKTLIEEQQRIFELFNINTNDERYKNLIEFIDQSKHHITYLHTTPSEETARIICGEGFIFEEFGNTTDEVNDEVTLAYKLLIRKQYGKFTIIIQINENVKDRYYEEISTPNDDDTFTLPPRYIRGYYNRETREIIKNPLFEN